MKITSLWPILFIILVFLSTTGEQCDINSLLFANNADYAAIKDVISRFKDGINSQSESILKGIVSKQFSAGGLDQLGVIKNYFNSELKINDINVSNISVDGNGAQARVDWTGTLIMKPKPDIPLVADKIPVLSADVNAGLIFGFVKESDGQWRIKAQRILQFTKSAVWGKDFPEINNFTIDKSPASPGDSIKVDASLKRVGGNVMFAAVNDKVIVNSINGVSDGPIKTLTFKVPSNKPDGSTYDIYVMALGVDVNFVNPSLSKIVGISIKQVSVPVAF